MSNNKFAVQHYRNTLALFEQDCIRRNLSGYTVRNYRRAVLSAFEAIEANSGITDVSMVTIEDIQSAVIDDGIAEGLKVTSINATLRGLRAFYGFAESRGLTKNIAKSIKLLKERQDVVETFSNEDLTLLFGSVNRGKFEGQRDYTMMLVLLETGIRLKELVGIKISDIKSGYLRITETKGGKARNVPVQNRVSEALSEWLDTRSEYTSEYLFITAAGTPMQNRAVEYRIAGYGQAAGIANVRCSPHTFRHTFAKMSVQNGANLFELQAILGHSNLEMVRRYVNLFSNDIIEGHARFSPLKGLTI